LLLSHLIRAPLTDDAEYSVDAGDWKYAEPVGQLSDAKTEKHDFKVAPEADKDGSPASEHTVVVRVHDHYNMGAGGKGKVGRQPSAAKQPHGSARTYVAWAIRCRALAHPCRHYPN